MPRYSDLTKEQKIKKEAARLRRTFKDLDGNKRKIVEPLILSAAFMTVSLAELEETINEQGYTVEYQNGANQSGTKQSDEVKTHLAMTKNLTTVIAKLAELVPAAQSKKSRLQAFKEE